MSRSSMSCSKCGGGTTVLMGTTDKREWYTERARVCTQCKRLFYTIEVDKKEIESRLGDCEGCEKLRFMVL